MKPRWQIEEEKRALTNTRGNPDPDEAYEPDDPKHSTWLDRHLDWGDMDRKRRKGE